MRLIIEIEARQSPERPFNGKESTVVTRSMRVDTGSGELGPRAIDKARHNAELLLSMAEAIDKAIAPLCRPTAFLPSDSHRGGQTDSQSQRHGPDLGKGK